MINEALIVGRVGSKDTKILKSGEEFTVLSIATTKKYKDSKGTKQEKTTWHNVSCFNKLSEIAEKYVNVGDLILIKGEIQNKKVEHGERAGQYIYSIHCNDIRFVQSAKEKADGKEKPKAKSDKKYNDFEDDDIPNF